jgi:hypothetical protein
MAMVYQFRPGTHTPRGADAQKVGARLAAISRVNGGLTAETVCDNAEANPKDPILGPWFEWDVKTAVRKLHIVQAREIIRSVFVVHVRAEGPNLETRAFVHLVSEDKYEPIEVVIRTPDKRKELLDIIERDEGALHTKHVELIALIKLLS